MRLHDIAESLRLECLTPEIESGTPTDLTRGYASDLLSDVLAYAPEGSLLVTVQVHMNVVAVCVHAGVAAVVFASGRTPEELVHQKAAREGIQLFVSTESVFDVVGQLYALGIRGPDM